MGILYVDTSALGRCLLGETDGPAIIGALARYEQHVASRLAAVELRRLGARSGRGAEAESLLAGISLIPITDDLLDSAAEIEAEALGTLDAIHLATALELAATQGLRDVLTYDKQLASAAERHGLAVLQPGGEE